MIKEFFFEDQVSLLAALLENCQSTLAKALADNVSATLLVSGGSSPKPLYQQLSYSDLPWSRLKVALVDERWVEPGMSGSNETFIRDNLLQHQAADAQFIGMKNSAETALLGLKQCEENYAQLSRPFDLTILGMGPDGHTASLFPDAHGLTNAMDVNQPALCAAIEANKSEVTGELTERMSLTLYGLMQSKQINLLITGEEKLKVYRKALSSPQQAFMSTPVCAVLQQSKVPVTVYWAP